MSIGRAEAWRSGIVSGLALALLLMASFACQRSSNGSSDQVGGSPVVEPQLGPYRLGASLATNGPCSQYHDDGSCLAQKLGEHYDVATLEGKIVRVQETFPSGQTDVLGEHLARTYGGDYESRTGLGLVIWEWELEGMSVQAVFDENPSVALYSKGSDRSAFEAASAASRARAQEFLDGLEDSFVPLVEELGPASYEQYKALRLSGMTDENAREVLASAPS